MKKLLLSCLVVWTFVSVRAQAVPDNRTPEKKAQDEKEMAAFEKEHPELYRFNRAPFLLMDSSAMIDGYTTSIIIKNNFVIDSVKSNFHNGMPDTTTVIPYCSVNVAGPRVNISFSHFKFLPFWGAGTVTPADSATMGAAPFHGMQVPVPKNANATEYVRISLNGKYLFDWKPIDSLPRKFCKFHQDVLNTDTSTHSEISAYTNVYQFCDMDLNVHDRLLIEVKQEPKNWMIDRYIITRVARSPIVKAGFSTSDPGGSISQEETAGPSLEKKTSSAPILTR